MGRDGTTSALPADNPTESLRRCLCTSFADESCIDVVVCIPQDPSDPMTIRPNLYVGVYVLLLQIRAALM
jgi:hypothetical protein